MGKAIGGNSAIEARIAAAQGLSSSSGSSSAIRCGAASVSSSPCGPRRYAAGRRGRTAPRRADHAAICRAAAELRRLRRYVDPREGAGVVPPARRDDLVWFLGGFFSGEGHLQLDRHSARLVVKLRRDDRPLLQRFAAGLGIGRVYDLPAGSRGSPQASWVVYRHDELATAINVLDRGGLRGRKRREYVAWRRGAAEFAAARAEGRRRSALVIDAAVAELRAIRAYAYRDPPQIHDRSNDMSEARSAYDAVLHECAAQLEGPLTCTAYDRLRRRHPRWPTRNTIALAFGGWADAVRAVGLEDRLSARARHGFAGDHGRVSEKGRSVRRPSRSSGEGPTAPAS